MKKLLPYIVAVAVFGVVTAVMFWPQAEGRRPAMHDVVQYEASARDIVEMQREGEDPQWTGASFSGMPAYFVNIKYPGAVLAKAQYLFRWAMPGVLIFIAMVAFFAMLGMMRVGPWASIAPSLAYGLSTYFVIIIAVGHITKMMALAYAPLLVGAVWMTFRRNMWMGGALSALFGGLLISANHPQITYYFLFILVALWVNELVQRRGKQLVKATCVLLGAGVLAVGANFAPLWYAADYAKESQRGGSELAEGDAQETKGLDLEYATQWSYGVGETLNMYIPYLYGGSSEGNFSADGEVAEALAPYGQRGLAEELPSYWGPQPMTSGPTYLGAATLFLAVLAMFWLPKKRWAWVAAVSVVAILLSWGNHFMWFTRLFFEWFPGYDKFRTVSMILVIVEWTVPLLAAWTLCRIWKGERDGLLKATKNTIILLGGLSLVFILFGGSLLSFSGAVDGQLPADVAAAMRGERASMMRGDAWRGLWFVFLGATFVIAYARDKVRRGWVMAAFAIFVVADMAAVDGRFLKHKDFVFPERGGVAPTQADLAISEDKELGFRVFDVTGSPFNDARASAFHRSVGGYSAVKLQRYQDVIDRYLVRGDRVVLGKLNVKYIITPEGVVDNPEAYGAAWFVEELRQADTPREEIETLGREAVIDSTAHIALVEYRPNYLKYEYSSPHPATAVFSEIYYPKGWQAYVDGEPAQHFRTDYILRAMELPAGEHSVEFRFRSAGFGWVNGVTLGSTILILLALIAAYYGGKQKAA